MPAENYHIKQCLEAIEAKLNWGNSKQWTHQDFINLSEKIQEETGQSLSYITLKRVWGKVTYNSLPNLNTLNTLANFLGHDSWRSYQHLQKISSPQKGRQFLSNGVFKNRFQFFKKAAIFFQALSAFLVIIWIVVITPAAKEQVEINPEDFDFSSKKIVSQGIPNSVVFDIEASKSPHDSIQVQQSWDKRRRTTIPKDHTQHTSIYYFPGFFEAKLVVGGQIVKEHQLHITTNGWYCAVQQEPVPVYFPLSEVQSSQGLEITEDHLRNKSIPLQPQVPLTRIGNVRDFQGLKTDNFVFEATIQNTYKEGSGICQYTQVYLLCEGNIVKVPLSAKGCVSSTSLYFVNHSAKGKEKDLSAFGVDFDKDVHLKIKSVDGKASIFLDHKLVYSIDEKIKGIPIKGIDFRFQGLGKVDDVKIGKSEEDWLLMDTFN